ncbi:MAG: SDR family NAD(P)-dependent oxidoreductase [Candidatus Pelethousia sp.]|nr:SDR family NAD(P)-dependent oxidoreductase [Candidatus Pelethousia sp.]
MPAEKKAVVVTGATSGIGLAVCELLIKKGFCVLAVGRCAEHCERAKKALLAQYPEASLACFFGDLVQQREVLRVADEIGTYLDERCNGRLWGLVNNAGCVRSWYMTSEEGYEQQFALNHLAGFLLAHRLLPYLKAAKGRVLFTSSQSHKHIKMRWHDPMFQKRYHPLLAYKQSKLCNLLTVLSLNRQFGYEGIAAYCVDPGLVNTAIGNKKTGWLVGFVWEIRRRHGLAPEVAARTYGYLLQNSECPDGLYFGNCLPKPYSSQVNRSNADRLYALSQALCNIVKEEVQA